MLYLTSYGAFSEETIGVLRPWTQAYTRCLEDAQFLKRECFDYLKPTLSTTVLTRTRQERDALSRGKRNAKQRELYQVMHF